MSGPTSFTYKISDEQSSRLKALLVTKGFTFNEVPHAEFAASKDKLTIVMYRSRKLLLQGKPAREFIEFVLEPEILKEARLGYEDVLEPDRIKPRIGVDESGKGDFFGPLTAAGVYVNPSVVEQMAELGVRDSKSVSSDKKIAELANAIRKIDGCVIEVVTIGNEAYNRLYRTMKSVNRILAWAHARVIENLLGRRYQMKPEPERVICDQFAATEKTVKNALMGLGREVEIIQRHKAESDLAVAAASIMARDAFVKGLGSLGQKMNAVLPKGASARVEDVGREIVAKHGVEILEKVAKTHFRTAYRIKGLPEPPKSPWRGKG